MSVEKKHIYFLRWGNLNPVKHKEARGANDETWYHVAPCYKGIYAFPQGYVEPFLLGGKYGEKRAHFLKDKNGELIDQNNFYGETYDTIKPEYTKLLKKKNISRNRLTSIYNEQDEVFYMAYNDKPKHFYYSGDIWHHLGDYVDKKDIIAETHGWYKTSFEVYLKALHKCDVDERFQSYMFGKKKGERHGNPHTYPRCFSNDYYEVFIEHLK